EAHRGIGRDSGAAHVNPGAVCLPVPTRFKETPRRHLAVPRRGIGGNEGKARRAQLRVLRPAPHFRHAGRSGRDAAAVTGGDSRPRQPEEYRKIRSHLVRTYGRGNAADRGAAGAAESEILCRIFAGYTRGNGRRRDKNSEVRGKLKCLQLTVNTWIYWRRESGSNRRIRVLQTLC